METRTQRPSGWEHGSRIDFSPGGKNGAPQGPAKGPAVTSRSMQAPIPSEVIDSMESAPQNFISQIIAGRPGMAGERARPGDSGNVASGGFGPSGGPTTGGTPTIGATKGGSHFGASKGGF